MRYGTWRTTVRAAAVLIGCAGLTFAGWGNGVITGDQEQLDCDCGVEIDGDVGKLTGFNSSGGGSTTLTTTGSVGGKFDGSRYPLCTRPLTPKDNTILHTFVKPKGEFAMQSISISLDSSIAYTGSAHRLDPNDPQWWWDSTIHVNDNKPTMAIFFPDAPEGSQWVPIGLIEPTEDTRATATGGDLGDQHATPPTSNNNNGTNPPSSVSVGVGTMNGGFEEIIAFAIGTTTATKVQVTYSFHSDVKAEGDNVVVSADKLELTFTAETKILDQ